MNAEGFGDARRQARRRVGRFDRFAEAGLDRVGQLTAVDGDRRGLHIVKRHDPRPAAARGVKDCAGRCGWVRGFNCRVGGVSSCSQVGAAEEGDFNLSLDDQRERDGILFLPQEAFRAVDGVECPEPRGEFLFAAAIDPVAGLFAGGFDADRPQLFEHAIEEGAVFFAAKGSRFFLADDRIARKGVTDQPTNGRLAGEVGDGDGAAILFFKHVGRDFGLHVATNPRGGTHGIESDPQLGFPSSGLRPFELRL